MHTLSPGSAPNNAASSLVSASIACQFTIPRDWTEYLLLGVLLLAIEFIL